MAEHHLTLLTHDRRKRLQEKVQQQHEQPTIEQSQALTMPEKRKEEDNKELAKVDTPVPEDGVIVSVSPTPEQTECVAGVGAAVSDTLSTKSGINTTNLQINDPENEDLATGSLWGLIVVTGSLGSVHTGLNHGKNDINPGLDVPESPTVNHGPVTGTVSQGRPATSIASKWFTIDLESPESLGPDGIFPSASTMPVPPRLEVPSLPVE